MNGYQTNQKMATWFLVLAILLAIWDLMGVVSFFQHISISDEAIQAMPQNERELYESYPMWTEIAFAIAVFGGFLGSILLLVKKKLAKPVFIVSLIAVVIQMYHSLFIAKAMDVYGPGATIMPVMIIGIGIFQIWMSSYGIKEGWLR